MGIFISSTMNNVQFGANPNDYQRTIKQHLLSIFRDYVLSLGVGTNKTSLQDYLSSREGKDTFLSALFCKVISESDGMSIAQLFIDYIKKYIVANPTSTDTDAIGKFLQFFDVEIDENGKPNIVAIFGSDEEINSLVGDFEEALKDTSQK